MDVILRSEGGYVNDPADLGGETKYGITKRRYPELDIPNMTIEKAKEIYYDDFYIDTNLQYINDDLLALHVMDMGINAGRKVAVRILQELLKDVKQDGVLGPATGTAIANASIHVDMVTAYKAKRIERYYYISTLRDNSKFLKGWINRVHNTKL